jgi:hypothetical protein
MSTCCVWLLVCTVTFHFLLLDVTNFSLSASCSTAAGPVTKEILNLRKVYLLLRAPTHFPLAKRTSSCSPKLLSTNFDGPLIQGTEHALSLKKVVACYLSHVTSVSVRTVKEAGVRFPLSYYILKLGP